MLTAGFYFIGSVLLKEIEETGLACRSGRVCVRTCSFYFNEMLASGMGEERRACPRRGMDCFILIRDVRARGNQA